MWCYVVNMWSTRIHIHCGYVSAKKYNTHMCIFIYMQYIYIYVYIYVYIYICYTHNIITHTHYIHKYWLVLNPHPVAHLPVISWEKHGHPGCENDCRKARSAQPFHVQNESVSSPSLEHSTITLLPVDFLKLTGKIWKHIPQVSIS